MGKLAIITDEIKELLVGKKYDSDSYFRPTNNANGRWVVGEEEIRDCTNEGFEFLNDLELTDHEPIVSELPTV